MARMRIGFAGRRCGLGGHGRCSLGFRSLLRFWCAGPWSWFWFRGAGLWYRFCFGSLRRALRPRRWSACATIRCRHVCLGFR